MEARISLPGLIYQGTAIQNNNLLEALPSEYSGLLKQINGFIIYGGGLHIRGICETPEWHSLNYFWKGGFALARHYPALAASDIPFGQDAVGDQFILRESQVYRLYSETGDLKGLNCGLLEFLENAQKHPIEYLGLQPLVQYYKESGNLQLGQLLSVYPPFCTKEAANGVSLKAVPALERLGFLVDFAHQINDIPEGSEFNIKVVE